MMQVAPEQGALLTLLVRPIGARRALEIGTFTGYSAICLARGLPATAARRCDVSEEWTAIARRYCERRASSGRIELRIGPAIETLARCPDEPLRLRVHRRRQGHLHRLLGTCRLALRPGGLVMIDNVLYGGPSSTPSPRGVGALVAALSARPDPLGDERVDIALLGVVDGVTLALKR